MSNLQPLSKQSPPDTFVPPAMMNPEVLKGLLSTPNIMDEVNKALAEKSLEHYTRQAWHIIEPGRKLIWNWHLSAICEHLEAVTSGQIQYLIINIPPRHTKSITVSVMWPTWEWGPRGLAHYRYVYSAYAESLSKRDSKDSRRLILSPWYQNNWGDKFNLTSDQNAKTRYDNNHTGFRLATSVKGLGTGEGGDRIVCDDPHNVLQAESDQVRTETLRWWDETMASRVNDEDFGAYVLIGQRTHHADLFGHIIEKAEAGDIDLVKLILPSRYEKEREKKLQTKTPLAFVDPRTEEDEPIDKNRYPDHKLKKVEKRMTTYARAGQLQQRPSPRGGGMFKVDNFNLVAEYPKKHLIAESIRYWDKAGTEGTGDSGARTAGVLMFKLRTGKVFIANVVKGQWEYPAREKRIRQCAVLDNKFCITKTYTEQEPGSGGKESAQRTVKGIKALGFAGDMDRVTGDKEVRAEPYADAVELGEVDVLIADWTDSFIQEHEHAPNGLQKDQWDAAAGAYNKLEAKKKVVMITGGNR